ncbi:hypothetical protein [Petroclostridium sp. X23]|uniref:hypothetical protein n=1 Tax=Petroclostridium sp. X23 TaxID=3045146 RepID=UPI0024ADD026|nr:hypothetical protein [Petroclostridium sp. X23]WHH59922.1 hypothetical protein QKW49_04005 [Petroclostridium sp. X23]
MEKLILGVIFYFGWMFIKNALSQKNTKRATPNYEIPPQAPQADMDFFDEEEYEEPMNIEEQFNMFEYQKENAGNQKEAFVQTAPLESKTSDYEEQNRIKTQPNHYKDVDTIKPELNDEISDTLDFSPQLLLNGIIMSEVLGKPKARKS